MDSGTLRLQDLSDGIMAYQTTIKVLGAGGAGNNTIHRIQQSHLKHIQTIAVNTDGQNLLHILADQRILIGRSLTNGLGAGGDPVIGERSAEESREILIRCLEGTDLLFLTAGLGGGTGTGSLPVIAKIARDMGILTIAVVTMPFSEEGAIRWENAQVGLEKLRKMVDTIIVLRNDKLFEQYPDISFQEAFKKGDEILSHAVAGITELIHTPGTINLDFADIGIILRDGPTGLIGFGESNSENRAEEAARRAITHPLMDASISGAQSALIHVAGGLDMTLKEAREVVRFIARQIDPYARIIWGVTIDKALRQTVRVMVLATGIPEPPKPERIQIERMEKSIEITRPTVAEAEKIPANETQTQSIFDIKETILANGHEVSLQAKSPKPTAQGTKLFYTLFEEEASGDLNRLNRSLHLLRMNAENQRAVIEARQACKLLHASAQMFGFDEIAQLLAAIDDLFAGVQSREVRLDVNLLDSIALAIEMVLDLIENRSDGHGESGHLVDRLKELRNESRQSVQAGS